MHNRPGRPPAPPKGNYSTITLRIPADVKQALIDASTALDISMTDYVSALVRRELDAPPVVV